MHEIPNAKVQNFKRWQRAMGAQDNFGVWTFVIWNFATV